MNPENEFLQIEAQVVKALKTVSDPELGINVYDLGLIYKVFADDNQNVTVDMTLTSPNCPMAEELFADVRNTISALPDVKNVSVNIVFNPPWDKNMMSEEARLELGL